MTVTLTTLPVTLAGNGVTTVWPYTFEVTDADEIRLHLTDADGVITEVTDGFTVNVPESEVTYPVDTGLVDIPATGVTVTISRATPLVQEMNLVNGGPLDAEVIEEGFDYLTRVAQDMDEVLSRCIKYPVGTPSASVDSDTVLASVTDSAAAALASEVSAAASSVAAGISEANALASETAAGLSEVAAAASAAAAANFFKSGTFDAVDALGSTTMFFAHLTDMRVAAIYLGDRALGTNGWIFLGGY